MPIEYPPDMSGCHPQYLSTLHPHDLVARVALVQLFLEGIYSNVDEAGIVDDEEVAWAVVGESEFGDG